METRDPRGRLQPNKNVPVMNALGYFIWQTLRNLIYHITLSRNKDKTQKLQSGGGGSRITRMGGGLG